MVTMICSQRHQTALLILVGPTGRSSTRIEDLQDHTPSASNAMQVPPQKRQKQVPPLQTSRHADWLEAVRRPDTLATLVTLQPPCNGFVLIPVSADWFRIGVNFQTTLGPSIRSEAIVSP